MMACVRHAWLLAFAVTGACSFPHHFVPPPTDAAIDSLPIGIDAVPDAATTCPVGASPAYTVIDLGPGFALGVAGSVVGGIDEHNVGAVWIVDPASMAIDQLELPTS
jgi:hypothetical protein